MSTLEASAIETCVTTTRAYKDAVNVQDACNPTGITSSFKDATLAARNDLETVNAGFSGTYYTRHHPIVVLFASKMHDLCGLGLSDSTRYGLAYSLARKVSNGELRVDTAEYADALNVYYNDFYHSAG